MAEPESRPEEPDDDDELAADIRPKSAGSLSLSLTLVGLVVAGYLLFDMREDVVYFLSSGTAVDLGADGDWKKDHLRDNVFATIHGTPGPVADRYKAWGATWEIVAVRGSPVLVRRAPLTGELPVPPGAAPFPPDQKPFQATGRLMRDTSLPSFASAYQALAARGEAVPSSDHLWVLLDGASPRSGWETPAMFALLACVLGLNGWSLARYLRRRYSPKA